MAPAGPEATRARAPLASMTGHARAAGAAGGSAWAWEVRSVNGKGLDLRCRLPPGLDAVEAQARGRAAARFARGTVQLTLTLQRARPARTAAVNREALGALLAAVSDLPLPAGIRAASLDGLLALPGVVEIGEAADEGPAAGALEAGLLATLEEALAACAATRTAEGARLGRLLGARLDAVGRLVAAAEAAPGRTPEAIRDRLARRVADLAGAVPALDPGRLHAEAVLLAAKADVREELDRLALHRAAASALIEEGGPVGRRLDFLAQELGREASTLCAKSGDAALTMIGLDLRTEIDQFREQVQNLE